ncbi:hypothetical protein PISMIDRAFT_19658 [Pisolithus microcarpus 441]|uniref:Uncharacterized protein n=1 Tax=Pisolithus microcarpus 441 TaxID=765257 RepID=A0A0C9YB99_9AGAM|nr:hypothetical protein PISMIDRAFT_19658 [Pisolithus microcarpus 441]
MTAGTQSHVPIISAPVSSAMLASRFHRKSKVYLGCRKYRSNVPLAMRRKSILQDPNHCRILHLREQNKEKYFRHARLQHSSKESASELPSPKFAEGQS